MGMLDTPAEAEGVGLETLFLQSFLAINDYKALGYQIYFWRTTNGQEVDFIVYGPKGFFAFEIKRTHTVTANAFKGLRSFHQDYPQAKLYLVYTGSLMEYHGEITVIPMKTVLEELPTILK